VRPNVTIRQRPGEQLGDGRVTVRLRMCGGLVTAPA